MAFAKRIAPVRIAEQLRKIDQKHCKIPLNRSAVGNQETRRLPSHARCFCKNCTGMALRELRIGLWRWKWAPIAASRMQGKCAATVICRSQRKRRQMWRLMADFVVLTPQGAASAWLGGSQRSCLSSLLDRAGWATDFLLPLA